VSKSNFPSATVNDGELVFAYEDTRHDTSAIKAGFQKDLDETKKLLGWAGNDIRTHNEEIGATARRRLGERRAKLVKDEEAVQSLGYPVRRRSGAPTLAIPIVRKTIPVPQTGAPEIIGLGEETYEDILRTITSMSLVIERSPHTFHHVDENFLRTLFLVVLNADYQGEATGETFNYQGKTDILIRQEGKNLFIAECKFWNGAKTLTDTIDQLLGYATWRDTKTAILLFNRNKNFTSVIKQVPDIVKKHPNFVRQHQYPNETGFRCTLRQNADPQRHLTLTILAFDVPTPETT
jgi:hypothetical protein